MSTLRRSRGAFVGLVAILAGLTSLTGCHAAPMTDGSAEAIAAYRAAVRSEVARDAAMREAGGSSVRPATGSAGAAARLGAGSGDARGLDGTRDARTVVDAPLDADRAVVLAKKNSARVAELGARVAERGAAIEAAGQRKNPELRVTQIRVARVLDGEGRAAPRLRFSPERPGELDARIAEARADEAEARAALALEERAIEAEVRWLFDDVLLLDAEIAAADRMASARRDLAARGRERVANATGTPVDASLAELSAIEADEASASRRARRALALDALCERIGVAPSDDLRLAGDSFAWPPPPLAPESVLVERALRQSARIASAAARVDGTAARLHAEEIKRWPWFTFVDIGYAFSPESPAGLGWTVGAGIDVPIFQTNGGAVRAAEAGHAASRRGLSAEAERTVREVRSQIREVEAAAALVSAFRHDAEPAIVRARAEAAHALAASAIDANRAFAVEERAAHVELRLLDLVRRYRLAVAALRRVVGGTLREGS